MTEDPKLAFTIRCEVITRESALREIEESIQRSADEAHEWLITECGLDERQERDAMQRVYVALDQVRQRALAEIDRLTLGSTPERLH
jgi:hypothetical protein